MEQIFINIKKKITKIAKKKKKKKLRYFIIFKNILLKKLTITIIKMQNS